MESQSTSGQVLKRPAPSTAWKPGQSGNPGGRVKTGTSVAETLRQMLEEVREMRPRDRLTFDPGALVVRLEG